MDVFCDRPDHFLCAASGDIHFVDTDFLVHFYQFHHIFPALAKVHVTLQLFQSDLSAFIFNFYRVRRTPRIFPPNAERSPLVLEKIFGRFEACRSVQ